MDTNNISDISQAETELSLIKQMMIDSRQVVIDNGWHYIFWGVVTTVGLLANYVMALNRVAMNYAGIMWLVLIIGAAITAVIVERNANKKRRVRTFAARLLGSLWTASGIAMFMIGFIGPMTGAYNSIYICSLISIVLGISYYTSGQIQQLKWMQMLSLGWWLGGIFTFVYPSVHTLLIFASMMLCLQTIPGIILYRKWKKANQAAV